MKTLSNVTFLGTSDEVDACDCCGRTKLKSTVALETEEGQTVFFGVVCAAKALKRTTKEIKSEARKADEAKRQAEMAAQQEINRAKDAEWQAFLDSQVTLKAWDGKSDRMGQIEALGGFAAAKLLQRLSM